MNINAIWPTPVFLILVASCATSTGPTPVNGPNAAASSVPSASAPPPPRSSLDGFPTRAEVTALAGKSLPPAKAAEPRAPVASWTLAGPFPERVGDAPMANTDALAALVLETAPAARTSENLQCAARELGRFMLDNDKARPEPRLERFLLMRCGATVESVSIRSKGWSRLNSERSDAAVIAEHRGDLVDAIRELTAGDGVGTFGAAFVRAPEAQRATAIFVTARPRIRVSAAPQAASGEAYVIGGTLNARAAASAELVYAHVTQGAFGAERCERDAAVELPGFSFRCPVLAADETAFIEIGSRNAGRVLGHAVGSVMVARRDGGRQWTGIEASSTAHLPGASRDRASILALINRARQDAGVAPLVLADAQSTTADRVAPHYFQEALTPGQDPGSHDVVALGLMAGWDVSGITIKDASFASLVDYSGRPEVMLRDALDRPSTRSGLLNKSATRIAIGAHAIDQRRTGVLLVAYEPLTAIVDVAAERAALVERLRSERAARQRVAPRTLRVLDPFMDECSRRIQAGEDPGAVTQEALKLAAAQLHRPMRSMLLETHDPAHPTFPTDLLQGAGVAVTFSVATRKRPGAPWGSTVILMLYSVDDTVIAGRARAADPPPT